MKVKCCTEVFSNQVGALMKMIISWNKLFDSLNLGRRTGPPGKPLKAITLTNSVAPNENVDFWKDAVKILSSLKYFSPNKQRLQPG
ncbi:hypothetical protein HUJ05_001682 [Dendroctonus ponderosae]|nr:hypothetical protein HUJ05_001682 [Dendroctonus ponderosae]